MVSGTAPGRGAKLIGPLSIRRFANRLEDVATESALRSRGHHEISLPGLPRGRKARRPVSTPDGFACWGVHWLDPGTGEGGHHILSAGLQSVRSAATVRIRDGKLSATDGPFAETKEILGGFTLINAKDFDEALQLAAKFPAARIGSMEVRPLIEPGEAAADPLDQKILAAILLSASEVNPFAASKMFSLPQPDSTVKQ